MASSTIVKRIGCKEENETLAEGQSRIIGSNNNASFVPPKVDKRRVAPLTPEEQIRRQRLDKIRRVSTQFCLYVILCTVAFLAFEVAGVLILSAANGSSFVATVWPNRVAHLAEEVAPSRVSGTSMSQNRSAVEISSLSEMFPFKQANSSLTSISQDWIAFVVDYYVQAWYYDKAFLSFISLPIFSLTGYLLFSIPLSLLVIFDCSFINKYYIQRKYRGEGKEFLHCMFMILVNHFTMFLGSVLVYPIIKPLITNYFNNWNEPFNPFNTPEAYLPLSTPWIYGLWFGQFVLTIYVEDFLYYILHWLLHYNRTLYKSIHAYHHKFFPLLAIYGAQVHPIEYLGISWTFFMAVVLSGSHYRIAYVFAIFRQWLTADSHCGFHHPLMDYVYACIPLHEGPDGHDFHHSKITGNYATFSTWWDNRFGTESKGFASHRWEVLGLKVENPLHALNILKK